jgi:ABC-type bacteriocin/lantibiotic exporter with double-glycine peptidase domain
VPKPSLPIEHRQQEDEAGCLAACAQMVLAHLGVTVSQADLNRLFELTPLGVPLSRLQRLTQSYKVQVTIHHEGSLADLQQAVNENTPLIIFIHTGQLTYWSEQAQHAVVVVGYDGSALLLNDPAFPDAPKQVPADEFILAWDEFDNIYARLSR